MVKVLITKNGSPGLDLVVQVPYSNGGATYRAEMSDFSLPAEPKRTIFRASAGSREELERLVKKEVFDFLRSNFQETLIENMTAGKLFDVYTLQRRDGGITRVIAGITLRGAEQQEEKVLTIKISEEEMRSCKLDLQPQPA